MNGLSFELTTLPSNKFTYQCMMNFLIHHVVL